MIEFTGYIIRSAIFIGLILVLAPNGFSRKYIGIISGLILLVVIVSSGGKLDFSLALPNTKKVEEARVSYSQNIEQTLLESVLLEIDQISHDLLRVMYPKLNITLDVFVVDGKFVVEIYNKDVDINKFKTELYKILGMNVDVKFVAL